MKYRVTLNGKVYEVEVSQTSAELVNTYRASSAPPTAPAPAPSPAAPPPVASAPAAPAPVTSGTQVLAPMPGTILAVNVSAGQEVRAGDILLVLEAMKMENEIVAPVDGIVMQVIVDKGSNVDTDAPLVVLG
ncbi:MAG: biotin/lipoyl-containing protein [Acutalibacteraceae bacterium]|jgi:biotin carboxyl carrier protein